MSSGDSIEKYKNQIRKLETMVSELKFDLGNTKIQLEEEIERHKYFQLIADFTFGWELWVEPSGNIKYCSPSCFDLTGFTANEIIASENISELLVYQSDRGKYIEFFRESLDQLLVNQSLEFRILTRTKQLRWCIMNVRGVYDRFGKYLGIRASIQDITRLKKAMGQISEMEAAKELESITKRRLQNEISVKDRELVAFLLQLSEKNELLTKVSNQLNGIKELVQGNNRQQIVKLEKLLVEKTKPLDWNVIESQLEKVHAGFLNRLQYKHPSISMKDRKLCAYLRLGLTSKEISGLLHIGAKSVEIARVRLRKKLKLGHKIRLVNYLEQI